jgi:hypothetical protein
MKTHEKLNNTTRRIKKERKTKVKRFAGKNESFFSLRRSPKFTTLFPYLAIVIKKSFL